MKRFILTFLTLWCCFAIYSEVRTITLNYKPDEFYINPSYTNPYEMEIGSYSYICITESSDTTQPAIPMIIGPYQESMDDNEEYLSVTWNATETLLTDSIILAGNIIEVPIGSFSQSNDNVSSKYFEDTYPFVHLITGVDRFFGSKILQYAPYPFRYDAKNMKLYLLTDIELNFSFAKSAPIGDSYNAVTRATDMSFVKEGKTWICSQSYAKDGRVSGTHYKYIMQGDSTINGCEYKKVYIQNEQLYNDNACHYFAAVKEEGNKVYIIYDKESSPMLLYDWDIEPVESDEYKNCDWDTPLDGVLKYQYPALLYCTERDDEYTRDYYDEYITMYSFSFHFLDSIRPSDTPKQMYKKIGWMRDPFNIGRLYSDTYYHEGGVFYGHNLVACYEPDRPIYNYEWYENLYNTVDAVENVNTDASTLTLHRNGDVLTAVFPTAGMGEAITLYDATGRVVAVQPIREGATTVSINVANLPKGIYIARLNSGISAKTAK